MLQTILEGITPYIWEIIGVILTTITSYIGLKIKRIYENKVNNETKQQIVRSVVEMVEQLSKKNNWNSEEKYERAKKTIINMVNQTGLKITELELEVLIESVCNSIKKN